ncbi:iron chelate uptake ABC transporter family permease subunit [Clostridium celatum]|uniref:Iron chelate uptake ABC transporter, FeCT family, permease protein n=1 Tax=Clostridium celatum DSM 1785 TaxID=545697 RepID=L1QBV3_9CLOT|nr:iron chelate uptake ABC transporter family permease subunit [Clostridium celatum]EKY25092.1 iron chelate uptake ABC transporter, FeCT family, permease protein [Clostridium celatum DSM 1785]MCE9655948.1 iron chelate uptake ABC transporter family permease subunit [Clostridium celatum]MDU3722743.1 iron chelate uptake ABC transporter family permease subunit [Clostridium celatum]MDU6294877.1 iron chelate uptake ABC transporter family permease subunit [Clostridium celatum]MDY3359618.1 iron chelat
MRTKDKRSIIILSLLALVLIGTFLLINVNSANIRYAMYRRIPKIYAMILTGGAIGFSSLIFQTVTNNRILTPSILGIDSLYVLLQTSVVFLLGSSSVIISNGNINFIITIVAMLIFSSLIYKFIFKKGSKNIFTLLLVGVVCGTLFESLTTFMQVLIDPVEFQVVQDKMQASFNNINTELLFISSIIIILCIGFAYDYLKVLDVMALGRDEAINLGVDYDKMVKKMLVIVVVLTSVATALVGPITFLGLLVVNIARQLITTYKHNILGVATILISIVALIGGQLLVEHLMDFGVSVSIIINFVGGIYFIYLVMKERNR